MKTIDLSRWARRTHYEFFARMDYPQFNICFDIPVTALLRRTRADKSSFYHSMIYCATRAANRVEEFRYRRRDNTVVLHDILHPAFTHMSPGDDLFRMIAVPFTDDLSAFLRTAADKAAAQTDYFIASDFAGRDDRMYITAIPWISFTHLSHTISLDRNDSVPRISWGRYRTEGAETLLPFSVQVNHCFADGVHIARYRDALLAVMDEITHSDASGVIHTTCYLDER
jgi:chloramphenicol O-acetyltransferase type A